MQESTLMDSNKLHHESIADARERMKKIKKKAGKEEKCGGPYPTSGEFANLLT